MWIYMPVLILLLGYSTIIAYFCVGLKCAVFLMPKWGKTIFFSFGALFFLLFSFFEVRHAMTVMSLVQVLLLFFNSMGIYYLRKDISFELDRKNEVEAISQ
jgi:AGCS family alanine or glycine:cation symporter